VSLGFQPSASPSGANRTPLVTWTATPARARRGRWGRARTFDPVEVSCAVDAARSLPASVAVSVGDGERYVPVEGARADRAGTSGTPTVIAFDAVRGSRLRLDLTSTHPVVS
jgi:beta-galactosidase